MALEYFEKNTKLRPTSESFISLANIQMQLGNRPDAEKNIKISLSMPLVSANLCEVAQSILGKNSEVKRKCKIF